VCGVTDRLVVDLGADGAIRVATVLDSGDLPSFAEAATLVWPLNDDALEDLRWYLEDYLLAPYGVYEDRGARIAGELDGWGRTVFKAVFGSGPARDAYLRMRTRGEVELVFRSDAPSLLGLPWELMADPARDTPLLYPIYSDHKKKGEKPAKDALARKARVEWRRERELTADGEKIIEIVSAEIIERDQ